MSEIEKNNEVQKVEDAAAAETQAQTAAAEKSFDEMSFEEALEASLQSLNTDERVHGVVVGIAPNEVQVEVVGRKQTGYIPLDELSADPNAKVEDLVKVGDELELLIMRTNDQEGTIMLSKKRVDAMKGWDKVVEAEESGAILEGTVTDIIKGWYADGNQRRARVYPGLPGFRHADGGSVPAQGPDRSLPYHRDQ